MWVGFPSWLGGSPQDSYLQAGPAQSYKDPSTFLGILQTYEATRRQMCTIIIVKFPFCHLIFVYRKLKKTMKLFHPTLRKFYKNTFKQQRCRHMPYWTTRPRITNCPIMIHTGLQFQNQACVFVCGYNPFNLH